MTTPTRKPRPSHPPTLFRLAERRIVADNLIEAGSRVLAAVSGGPDSMALLHVLSVLRAKRGFDLVAHGVVHGLRDEASHEVEVARQWAERRGIAFSVDVLAVTPGSNLHARARKARFASLRTRAQQVGAHVIALGHHAQDRAETVLIRLLTGSGPAGLAVMPSRANDLIRPLIDSRPSDILAHLQRHDVPFSRDPSNADPRFLRARVRYELLPLLEQLSPRIVAHLVDLSEDLRALNLDASPLRRSQLRQLADAHQRGISGVKVMLSSHRVATVDIRTGTIVVESLAEPMDAAEVGGCLATGGVVGEKSQK